MGLKRILAGFGTVFGIIFLIISPASSQVEAKLEWDAYYAAPGYSNDVGYSIAVDNDGNVYVSGRSQGYGSGFDYLTLKYDPDGNQLWEARYNGIGNGDDQAYALTLGTTAVYVTGKSYGADSGFDYLTIKYDLDGNKLWENRYNGTGNGDDEACDLVLDLAGNVYVIGKSTGSGSDFDYLIIKYDSNGTELWETRYNGVGNGDDEALALTVDNAGYTYATGKSIGIGTDFDFATIKIDPNGNLLWANRYNGVLDNIDIAKAIAVDLSGNVFVAGSARIVDDGWGRNDYAILKYDANGNQLWLRYNHEGANDDLADMVIDQEGNVYVTGTMWHALSQKDYVTFKYDTNGNMLWRAPYGGPGGDDIAVAIGLDGDRNVIVSGFSHDAWPLYRKYDTIKYDNNGNQLWKTRYTGITQSIIQDMAVGSDGFVYVTGYGAINDGMYYQDYLTIKYGEGPLNQAPVANAGENVTISSEEVSSTIIQGIATDEDDDALQFHWLEGETVLLDWIPVGENGECPLDLNAISIGTGTHTFTLEVSDSYETASDNTILIVENSAPHAAPTGGGVYEIFSPVTLGGYVSDFDGDLLTYSWSDETGIIFSGEIMTIFGGNPVSLPEQVLGDLELGVHPLTLSVSDNVNDPTQKYIMVEVIDTGQPTLAPVPNKTILWPPNHEMVEVTIEANASDNSGGLVTLSAAVKSNEPQEGMGDGDQSPDWTEPIIDQASGTIALQLRAERSGSGDGRIYTITITATDESDNSSQVLTEIVVPHDKGNKE
jgi:hypothetical protein